MKKDPVLAVLGGMDAMVIAALTAFVALGVVDLSGEQLAAISGAIVAVTGVAAAVLRGVVWSPESHAEEVLDALFSEPPVGVGGRYDATDFMEDF